VRDLTTDKGVFGIISLSLTRNERYTSTTTTVLGRSCSIVLAARILVWNFLPVFGMAISVRLKPIVLPIVALGYLGIFNSHF
jgi:hypothetical protein